MSNADSTPKVVVVVDPASSRIGGVVADLLRRDPRGFEVLHVDVEGARPLPHLVELTRAVSDLGAAARVCASFTRSFLEAGCPRFDVDAGRRRVELVLIIAALARP